MIHLFMRAGFKQKRHVEDNELRVLMGGGEIAAVLFDQRLIAPSCTADGISAPKGATACPPFA